MHCANKYFAYHDNVKFRHTSLFIAAILCTFIVTSCSSQSKPQHKAIVLTVKSGTSIQQLIDKAQSGDVVLVEPGTYSGNITILHDDITLRGQERNTVIIDGKFTQKNGITVSGDGDVVENLTVQAFTQDGISFNGKNSQAKKLERYGIAYVNAMNNGGHGISISSARNGTITETYSRANAGAGINIELCDKCKSDINNNNAEQNGIGMQVTNASDDIFVYENTFSNNRTGIHITTDPKAALAPESGATISSNTTSSNNADNAPTNTLNLFGYGIAITGGTNNSVQSNTSDSNNQVGIALLDRDGALPSNNHVKSNNSRSNGVPVGFDLAYIISGQKTVMSSGNCFENNSYSSSSVDHIQQVLPCDNAGDGPFPSQGFKVFIIPAAPEYTRISIVNQKQENMPGKMTDIPGTLQKISTPELSNASLPDG